MNRVLAFLAAVVLVGGAFVVRSKVIDSSDSSHDRRNPPAGGSVLTIACAPELMTVCNAAASKDLKVLADTVDVDNAAADAPKLDAWLTYGPAPVIVNADPSNQSKVFDDGTVIGSGRLAVVAPADRAAALAKHCRVPRLAWKCLVASAGDDWTRIDSRLSGTVKVGVGDPSSALGAILVGPLALATTDRQDPGIDDIDTKAVARVVSSVDQQPPEDELTDLTTRGPAAYSAVVAPEGPAQRAAASARGQGLGLTVIYPEPVATTVVVLTPPSGRQVPQAIVDAFGRRTVRDALARAGWASTKRGATTGLPAPDVLFALRKELSP